VTVKTLWRVVALWKALREFVGPEVEASGELFGCEPGCFESVTKASFGERAKNGSRSEVFVGNDHGRLQPAGSTPAAHDYDW
jgi:hypothetical protein